MVISAWLTVMAAASYQHFVVRRALRASETERHRYQQAIHFVTHEMRTPLTAIQGSSELIHTLLAHDLIDQLTLLTFPVILGSGKRLFDDGSQPRAWALTKTRQSRTGVVVNTYERTDQPPPTGSFGQTIPSEAELARRVRWAREDCA